VYDSVYGSVLGSVRGSVQSSVRGSQGSVLGSVQGYTASFFNLPKLAQFRSVTDLWDRGFVPSYDGKTWRLHHGPDAKIVYELNTKEQ